MYERMLDKQITPSLENLLNYCGARKKLWIALDSALKKDFAAQTVIRFPYGKDYGWSVKYSKGSKHICDIFAERGAFTVFLKLSDAAFASLESELSVYAKDIYAHKYPCANGGWIYYRVLSAENAAEIQKILRAKVNFK